MLGIPAVGTSVGIRITSVFEGTAVSSVSAGRGVVAVEGTPHAVSRIIKRGKTKRIRFIVSPNNSLIGKRRPARRKVPPTPPHPSLRDTLPKYEPEVFYAHPEFGSRIWGRLG
jgi:hypothetical protein